MELNKKEEFFLKNYKKEIIDKQSYQEFFDIENYPEKNNLIKENDNSYLQNSLNLENINNFLNFIDNPTNIDSYRNIDISFFEVILDMIKTFIDLSCKYGMIDDNQYLLTEYENVNDVTNSHLNILTSFKSTINSSLNIKENDFVLQKYYIENFCPHIPVEKTINSEFEIIIPPFLNCSYNDKSLYHEISLTPNYDYDFIKLLFELDESKLNILKKDFCYEFNEFQKNGIISTKLQFLSNIISNYLKKYATLKYQEYYLLYNDKMVKKLIK